MPAAPCVTEGDRYRRRGPAVSFSHANGATPAHRRCAQCATSTTALSRRKPHHPQHCAPPAAYVVRARAPARRGRHGLRAARAKRSRLPNPNASHPTLALPAPNPAPAPRAEVRYSAATSTAPRPHVASPRALSRSMCAAASGRLHASKARSQKSARSEYSHAGRPARRRASEGEGGREVRKRAQGGVLSERCTRGRARGLEGLLQAPCGLSFSPLQQPGG